MEMVAPVGSSAEGVALCIFSCDVHAAISSHHGKTYLRHPFLLRDEHGVYTGRLASPIMKGETSRNLADVDQSVMRVKLWSIWRPLGSTFGPHGMQCRQK